MASPNMIVLKSLDDETFEVEEAVAREFQVVAHMIEDGCAGKPIPITNVTGKILSSIIEYCKTHLDQRVQEEEEEAKKTFDVEFMKRFDMKELFELVLAANYLNVKSLLDLTCQKIADNIKDNTVEEVRSIFNIKSDFAPGEEEALRKENAWAFEP